MVYFTFWPVFRSCVAFTTRGRTMGVAARQQLNTNIKNTIINFKHLLGRKFSDQLVQKYQKFIPCEMIQLPNNDIGFKVYFIAQSCIFYCENLKLSTSCLKHANWEMR